MNTSLTVVSRPCFRTGPSLPTQWRQWITQLRLITTGWIQMAPWMLTGVQFIGISATIPVMVSVSIGPGLLGLKDYTNLTTTTTTKLTVVISLWILPFTTLLISPPTPPLQSISTNLDPRSTSTTSLKAGSESIRTPTRAISRTHSCSTSGTTFAIPATKSSSLETRGSCLLSTVALTQLMPTRGLSLWSWRPRALSLHPLFQADSFLRSQF